MAPPTWPSSSAAARTSTPLCVRSSKSGTPTSGSRCYGIADRARIGANGPGRSLSSGASTSAGGRSLPHGRDWASCSWSSSRRPTPRALRRRSSGESSRVPREVRRDQTTRLGPRHTLASRYPTARSIARRPTVGQSPVTAHRWESETVDEWRAWRWRTLPRPWPVKLRRLGVECQGRHQRQVAPRECGSASTASPAATPTATTPARLAQDPGSRPRLIASHVWQTHSAKLHPVGPKPSNRLP